MDYSDGLIEELIIFLRNSKKAQKILLMMKYGIDEIQLAIIEEQINYARNQIEEAMKVMHQQSNVHDIKKKAKGLP